MIVRRGIRRCCIQPHPLHIITPGPALRAGIYTLTVLATDSYGATAESTPVNVTIWSTRDINASNGSASYSSGVFTVAGRGTGITGTSDGFRFVYLPMNSNCTITARVTAVSGTLSSNSRSGIMVRATTASGSQELRIFTVQTISRPSSTICIIAHQPTGSLDQLRNSHIPVRRGGCEL